MTMVSSFRSCIRAASRSVAGAGDVASPVMPLSFAQMMSAPAFFRSTARTQHGEAVGDLAGRWMIPAATINLVFDGDSISAADLPASFPAQVWRGLADAGIRANYTNFAVSGQKLTDMAADGVAQVDSVYQAGLKNILFVWGGSNDMAFETTTPAQCHDRLSAYCATRKAVGWKVIACPIIRRKPSDVSDQEVADFAALVAANYTTYAHVHCNWVNNAAFSNVANTAYYSADQIHPNQAGHDVLATYAILAVNAALAL